MSRSIGSAAVANNGYKGGMGTGLPNRVPPLRERVVDDYPFRVSIENGIVWITSFCLGNTPVFNNIYPTYTNYASGIQSFDWKTRLRRNTGIPISDNWDGYILLAYVAGDVQKIVKTTSGDKKPREVTYASPWSEWIGMYPKIFAFDIVASENPYVGMSAEKTINCYGYFSNLYAGGE